MAQRLLGGDQQDVNCETGLQEEFVTLLRTSRNVDSRVISSSSNVNDYRGTGFLVVFEFVAAASLEPFQKILENIFTRIFWTGLQCLMKSWVAQTL